MHLKMLYFILSDIAFEASKNNSKFDSIENYKEALNAISDKASMGMNFITDNVKFKKGNYDQRMRHKTIQDARR